MPSSQGKRPHSDDKSAQQPKRPRSNNASAPQAQPSYLWNSWVQVKNAANSGELKVGQVLKMKGLEFHLEDTSIKTEEAVEEKLLPDYGKVDIGKMEVKKMRGTSQTPFQISKKATKKSTNTKSVKSATGQIKHFGIVLEITRDNIRIAATATFGASGKLTGNIRSTAMKYYLPVKPAELEEEMLHGPIEAKEGDDAKKKWVYLRWADVFEFGEMIQKDKGNGTSVQGPAGEVYSEDTVRMILGYIPSKELQERRGAR